MVDVPNRTEIDIESEELNDLNKTVDNSDNTEQETQLDNNISNLDNSQNSSGYIIQDKLNTQEIESSEVVNCLALTVKKDYNLAIVKNVFVKTFRNVWRIALSIFTLNFIKFFF